MRASNGLYRDSQASALAVITEVAALGGMARLPELIWHIGLSGACGSPSAPGVFLAVDYDRSEGDRQVRAMEDLSDLLRELTGADPTDEAFRARVATCEGCGSFTAVGTVVFDPRRPQLRGPVRDVHPGPTVTATVIPFPAPASAPGDLSARPPVCTCEHESHWPDDRYARTSRYRRASFPLHAAGARLPRGRRKAGVCASCVNAGHSTTSPTH